MTHTTLRRSRILVGIAVAIVVIAGTVFFTTLVRAVFYTPEGEITVPSIVPMIEPEVAQSASLPLRLQIPSLSINARVQQVGLNAKKNMAAPTNFTDVGWYKYGTVPGQLGSAVIDGHVDNGLALSGVFKRLGDMAIGDDVYITARDGSRLHFVVTDIQSYPYTDAPSERIFSAKDAAHLNLITCAGTWIKGKRTYDERLVVYTTYKDTIVPPS